MTILRKLILTLFAALFGLVFFWLIVLKIVSRLLARFGMSGPCPSEIAWIVDNPIRRRYMRPIPNRMDLRPGGQVLELGPGPGVFTLDAAQRLGPQGRLVVVDIQPEMIAQVAQRVRRSGLTNIEAHVASAYALPLPDASLDGAFLVTVLGEIPDPGRALAELRRVLKPGGWLSITEEFLDPDYPFDFETIRRVEAAGFKTARRFGNFWLYTLDFRKV